MLANHDRFTNEMRTCLQTTAIGLGLVRLLQDARRFDEAKTTLYAIEEGFQAGGEEVSQPELDSRSSASGLSRTRVAETLTMPSSIA
jgi:hypothetical protein